MKTILSAFRLHDQDGIPLSLQHDMAKASGATINFAAFACDALGAGWPEDRVRKTIEECRPDMDYKTFRGKLALLWAAAGSLPDPECWAAMKRRIKP